MDKLIALRFNDPAPDLDVQTAEGEILRLSTLWAEQPLVLVFTRHFGCPQCKEMLDRMVEVKTQIEARNLGIAVVMQAPVTEAKAFGEQRAPGLRCLADPQRKLYTAFGLGRGSLRQTFFSPQVLTSNLRLARLKGYRADLPPTGQDAMLMSGTFIIATDGRIRLPYYYDNIADHPSADLLFSGLFATDWQRPFDAPFGPPKDDPQPKREA